MCGKLLHPIFKIEKMKTLKIFALFTLFILGACSVDEATDPDNELEGLVLTETFQDTDHLVELYTTNGVLNQGYNQVWLRIKNIHTEQFVADANITWLPLMHMMGMQHSAPFSEIKKTIGKQYLYDGYMIFQMPENANEFWDLKIDYTINSEAFSVMKNIDVFASEKRNINVFTGADDENYVLALIEPQAPKAAINEMRVALFKMENMMSFPVVDNYSIKIDPRMPSMGNHSSPNNTDLLQETAGRFYSGQLSLTMSGFWNINLQVLDASGEVIKGENISDSHPQSSIYFELEF